MYKSLWEHMFSFLWGKYLVVECLANIVVVCLTDIMYTNYT